MKEAVTCGISKEVVQNIRLIRMNRHWRNHFNKAEIV